MSQQVVITSNALAIPFTATMVTNPADGQWLSVAPSAGLTPATLTLTVASGLKKGTYPAQISIASRTAENSPQEVSILLTVVQGSPPPPNGACIPPQSVFADDSGTGGLAETTLSNKRLNAGLIQADVLVQNRMRFWLTASAEGNSPTNPLLLPSTNSGAAGVAGLFYLVPPCATGFSFTPPFVNCSSPGTASWTVEFCSPGTETLILSITTSSFSVTLADFLLQRIGAVQTVTTTIDIAQQLYANIPLFKTAVDCAAKGTTLSNGACIGRALLELAFNQKQLNDIVAILTLKGIAIDVETLIEKLVLLPLDADEILADMVIYGVKTQSVGHLGTEVIKLEGR